MTPKKHLGQHFLTDETVALRIVQALSQSPEAVLEIGPGMGVLTKYLLKNPDSKKLYFCEIDVESVNFLRHHYHLKEELLEADFLQLDLTNFGQNLGVIGNFPYHISTQIMFHILEYREQIIEVVGMFQKEVAVRLAAQPNTKNYGILTVLLQAFYDIEYLFTVEANAFHPPPKVQSGVIRLVKNSDKKLKSPYANFKKVVKAAFNQRRKTLKNALTAVFDLQHRTDFTDSIWSKRAEQLSVAEFDDLTMLIFRDSKVF